jgi:hypothetical protein
MSVEKTSHVKPNRKPINCALIVPFERAKYTTKINIKFGKIPQTFMYLPKKKLKYTESKIKGKIRN